MKSNVVRVNALLLARLAACGFFAILFLQSGVDKLIDRKGNLDYLVPHFEKSPFRRGVPALLSLLTLLELASGLSAALSLFVVWSNGPHWIPVLSIGICCGTFLCLFLGQRLARDYAGAATIASYFGVALLSLYLMAVGFELPMPD